ncbi:hypothetical protein QVH35_00600 [Candidatus Nitrosotenuis chungbukensis]|uniref:hypothetical protein n=1 Tax=Candidatus Nitrosotenuis chungbukensis TaxID=1353246 RepID=UPI002673A015|nr:hypothetical protein [Candidatus Nitrosotenuis chungbukensis]WKT58071.1 hypothetical protein QVH35_00600 [Candidatus Nitrosotenuis chungbukensis]
MTDFVHEPYKTIHVRDLIKTSLDDLVNMVSTLEFGNVYWVDGVLFVIFAMNESEELAKKELRVRHTWTESCLQNMKSTPRLQSCQTTWRSTS